MDRVGPEDVNRSECRVDIAVWSCERLQRRDGFRPEQNTVMQRLARGMDFWRLDSKLRRKRVNILNREIKDLGFSRAGETTYQSFNLHYLTLESPTSAEWRDRPSADLLPTIRPIFSVREKRKHCALAHYRPSQRIVLEREIPP